MNDLETSLSGWYFLRNLDETDNRTLELAQDGVDIALAILPNETVMEIGDAVSAVVERLEREPDYLGDVQQNQIKGLRHISVQCYRTANLREKPAAVAANG